MSQRTLELNFVVSGMHCVSCGLLVDDVLEDLAGVERSSTDGRGGRTVVRVDPALTSAVDIIAAIADVGYLAEAAAD